MKWSWRLGEFRGIAVYMHATFLILIGFVVLSHWSSGHSPGKTLEGVAFVLALFSCVILHEFGHALMAARFGIKTRDITLLPIGGFARLERMPETAPVIQADTLVGLLTAENVSEFLLIVSALGERRVRNPTAT